MLSYHGHQLLDETHYHWVVQGISTGGESISESEPGGKKQMYLLSSPAQKKQPMPLDCQPKKKERLNRAIVCRSLRDINMLTVQCNSCVLADVWLAYIQCQGWWSSWSMSNTSHSGSAISVTYFNSSASPRNYCPIPLQWVLYLYSPQYLSPKPSPMPSLILPHGLSISLS